MQMFRNCADIKIEGSSGAGSSDPAPAPEEMVEETDDEEVVSLNAAAKPPAGAPNPAADDEAMEIEQNISGAGADMVCADETVQKVLGNLNCRRGRRGFNPLKCSDRATGVAENWSYLMCQECVLFLRLVPSAPGELKECQ